MMPAFYHCPRCQSFKVKEQEKTIFCPECELTFDKKFLQILKDEDILANEELEGVIDVFIEDGDDNDVDNDNDGNDLRLIP